MPGEAEVIASVWRDVELGRVVLFSHGSQVGKLAVIVEIVDHKRVLVDNPTPSKGDDLGTSPPTVPRTSVSTSNLTLTPIVIPNLPRAIGTGALLKKWTAHDVDGKFKASGYAQKRARAEKRRGLSDFERFKVMRLKKVMRFEERKVEAGVRAAAKA